MSEFEPYAPFPEDLDSLAVKRNLEANLEAAFDASNDWEARGNTALSAKYAEVAADISNRLRSWHLTFDQQGARRA